jgi:hypothetical protein
MQKRNVQRVPDVLLTQCLLTRKKKRPNACFPSGASICKKKKRPNACFPSGASLCAIFLYVFSISQRMLVQLVSTPAVLPQVAGSTPGGSEFCLRVKKSPSLVPCAKALVWAARFRPVVTGYCGNGILEVPAQSGKVPQASRPR